MDQLTWDMLVEIQGRLEADLIKSYLEAHGIDVELVQESIGHSAFPVTVDGLGRVQIFVAKDKVAEAKDWLKVYRQGKSEEE